MRNKEKSQICGRRKVPKSRKKHQVRKEGRKIEKTTGKKPGKEMREGKGADEKKSRRALDGHEGEREEGR